MSSTVVCGIDTSYHVWQWDTLYYKCNLVVRWIVTQLLTLIKMTTVPIVLGTQVLSLQKCEQFLKIPKLALTISNGWDSISVSELRLVFRWDKEIGSLNPECFRQYLWFFHSLVNKILVDVLREYIPKQFLYSMAWKGPIICNHKINVCNTILS